MKGKGYGQQILEPWKWCVYTIMANYNESLEAVDCHIHSVRYDMAFDWGACSVSDGLIRSPTMLQWRRYVQQILELWKRCVYTIMADYHESLEAVDCHIHSVMYDMAVDWGACSVSAGLIRSPTMLQWRRYVQQILEPWKRCVYTIITNYNGSLEAVDCHIHSVMYDMAVDWGACSV